MTTLSFDASRAHSRAVFMLASRSSAAAAAVRASTRQVPVGPDGADGPRRRRAGHADDTRASLPRQRRATLYPAADADGSERHVIESERHAHVRVSGLGSHRFLARLIADVIVPRRRQPDGRGRRRRRAHVLHGRQELQPTTRMYWRARAVQGSSSSDWSSPAMFKTKFVGYNRPGELYDPLIHGETIGTSRRRAHVDHRQGLRLDTETSYVRYQLAAGDRRAANSPSRSKGLHPDGPNHKFKIFSMKTGTADITRQRHGR